jgi:hypothetical protein
MKAYPHSLRARIVAAFDNEEGSAQELARRFGVAGGSFLACSSGDGRPARSKPVAAGQSLA